jgi:Protein of unknown function (DUF2958)
VKIFTAEIAARLAANGTATRLAQKAGQGEPDHMPVVKVFNPCGPGTWLLTESDPDEPDRLFGLYDLGLGDPELGYVLRSEIEGTWIKVGCVMLQLERDPHFVADKPLSAYIAAARNAGRIVS